jgi:hypothetical protein
MTKDLQQAIVADIRRVATDLETNELSRSDYIQRGKFTYYQLYDDGNSWSALCKLAGIRSRTRQAVTDETYFHRLAEAVKTLGRYPLASERKKFGLNVSKRRYANLSVFIEKAIELGHIPNLRESKKTVEAAAESTSKTSQIFELIRSALRETGPTQRHVPPIPLKTRRTKWGRTGLPGFPYAPQEEQGVLALFAILCARGVLPWHILDIRGGKGIDATCYDDSNQQEIQVELKYVLSKSNWNHPFEDLDYVVCWRNRWPSFPKPVIELSKLLQET